MHDRAGEVGGTTRRQDDVCKAAGRGAGPLRAQRTPAALRRCERAWRRRWRVAGAAGARRQESVNVRPPGRCSA